ncbi:hypothetical protein J7E93_04700 [Streptomyces sp. ISL-36]|uniref:DUF5949 family protein n=1 Tax=Streptomyces sp. ISL-36 TaxID=2819182 RepID=UPI001BECD0E7|nr:DUF5949 family protein [Streptomyces sp. ISL-36]MBT2439432.1 hypothetical protein [Streptomyces sp. ISL-36]
MTSSNVVSEARSSSPLGSLSVVFWTTGPTDTKPAASYLMVYSLGDGSDGPEAGAEAMRAAVEGMGLTVGGPVVDASQGPRVDAHLLVEAQQAVLTLPFMKLQCSVPVEWEAAAKELGHVYLVCSVRPWPEGAPGGAVSEEQLRSFFAGEDPLADGAHVVLPVRRLQG